MNNKIILFLAFILSTQLLYSQPGPTNANRYNAQLKSVGYHFNYDDETGVNEPRFTMDAASGSTGACQVGGDASGYSHTAGWNADTGPNGMSTNTSSSLHRNLLQLTNVESTRANISYFAMEHNCGHEYLYTSCDGSWARWCFTRNLVSSTNGPGLVKNEWVWDQAGGQTAIKIATSWRYFYGNDENYPLTFGTFEAGSQARLHNNSNRRAHSTMALGMGYSDEWETSDGPEGVFGAGQDVTYSFSVTDYSRIIATTDYSNTSFDTKLHLIKDLGNGDWEYISSHDNISASNNKSRLETLVPPGDYFIVVDGPRYVDQGTFRLVLFKFDASFTQGNINHPGSWVKHGCSINVPISSTVDANTSHGTSSYFWQRKAASASTWTTIQDATNETLTDAEMGPITEDTDVRRGFTSLGYTEYSDTLFFEALNSSEVGTIGRISGKITGKNGNGEIPNVIVRAIPAEPIPGACLDETYQAVSIANGEYVIPGIYHGLDTTTWKIVPEFLDHKFDPDTFTLELYPLVYQRDNINFQDTTTLFISGRMTQSDPNSIGETVCGIPDVGLFLNDMNQLPRVTDEMGSYSLSLINRDPNDQYIVRPDTTNYQFTPAQSQTLVVLQDTSGIDFENTNMDTISGSVLACGDFYFGQVYVGIEDLHGCFRYSQLTDENGYYEVIIPAREYEIRVDSMLASSSVDPQVYTSGAVKQYFQNIRDTLDITKESAFANFQYRQKPVMVINNLPTKSCNGEIVDTVFTQGEQVELIISVYEANTNQCPLDTGLIYVRDSISLVTDTISVSNGVAYYTVHPGEPDIFSPYTKNLNFRAEDIDNSDLRSEVNMNVIVEGNRARTASFATVSPELPMFILRDPPGDGSSSFIETSETFEVATSFSTLRGGGVNLWGQVKAGAQFEAGFLGFATESEAWATDTRELDISGYNSSSTESIWSITNTTRYSTNDGDEIMGRDADVFVAGALNVRYALADIIEYNTETCTVEESVDLIMGVDSIGTVTAFSRNNIVNGVIPELEVIRDLLTDPDSIRNWNMQIDAWNQILDLNDQLKEDAYPDPSNENYTWDGGIGSIQETSTATASSSSILEFQLEIDQSVAIEAGFEVAGSGISGGVDIYTRIETGGSKTNTNLSSRTVGFTLADDDPEDEFVTGIYIDPTYGTPVFRDFAKETTCPYEGGLLIDRPLISVDNPVAIDVDPNGKAFFNLAVTNGTELSSNSSNSVRTIYLDVVDKSNPHSAVIKPGGDQTFPLKFENMERGETINRLITIERTDPNIFTLEGIEFIVYPECDGQTNPVSSTTSVSAFFVSACSEITMNAPDASVPWKVNENDDNNLSVHLTDYNRALIDEVILQYTPTGLNSWTNITTIQGSAMNSNATTSGGTFIDWNVSNVPDGEYDIRIRLNCNTGSTFTQRVTGIIDRIKPIVYGLPSPIDDDYDLSAGDEISAQFTEEIVCTTETTAILMNMATNEEYSVNLTCGIDKVSIVPDQILGNLDPAPYRIVLDGVRDKNNNVSDTYRWAFIVGDYVYDPDCSPIMIANNNINQDAIAQFAYYSEAISSNGIVGGGTNIEFNSEQTIEFLPGFEVKQDAQLQANITDCPND